MDLEAKHSLVRTSSMSKRDKCFSTSSHILATHPCQCSLHPMVSKLYDTKLVKCSQAHAHNGGKERNNSELLFSVLFFPRAHYRFPPSASVGCAAHQHLWQLIIQGPQSRSIILQVGPQMSQFWARFQPKASADILPDRFRGRESVSSEQQVGFS
ncbi:hypothetical protein BDN72DRAFT_258659 [Pluteus cervinus]|uniref:Uncharacterized protein n=1 Tax=Pluteus cervinus TaxID=181527 RepID=A0ACD3B5G5_9AGAR|nr:hypothetical protein BDN72DRAFT_258659 [Pluteus cervinus]